MLKIKRIRLILVTEDGEKEVTFFTTIQPMELSKGEMATLRLPIMLDENDQPIVPADRTN